MSINHLKKALPLHQGAAAYTVAAGLAGAAKKLEEAASNAQESISSAYQRTEGTIKNDPKLLLIPAGVAVGVAAAPLVMGPALAAAGFSSIGPVAGSLAAGIQSAGWAGATFSTVQSAAMGGYGVTAVTTAFSAVGGVLGGAAGVVGSSSSEKEESSEDDEKAESAEEGGEGREKKGI